MLTVVTSESLHERREDPRLNKLVVDNLSLGRLASIVGERRISISELSSNGAISDSDSCGTSENHSSLLNNVGTNVSPVGSKRNKSAKYK